MAVRWALKSLLAQNTGDYEIDGEAVTGIYQLHAGDADKSANLLFTYTPIETIIDGELKFSVPRDGLTRKRTVRAQPALLSLIPAVESDLRIRLVAL